MMHYDFLLPPECILRKAVSLDRLSIVFAVFKARLDPNQLRWQQFWVIESDGCLIALGQLRKFHLAQELGSLYVVKKWRKQGLGSFLVQHLISQATQPLYLKCVNHRLVNFYAKKGFIPIEFNDLPSSLKYKFRLSQARKKFLNGFVVFMKYQAGLDGNIEREFR
jgi:amino-acid N-acetyltransferase